MFTAGVDYSSYFARCHWHESCSSPSLSKQQKAFGLICLRVARKFLSLCVALFCLTTSHGSQIWSAIPARSWRTDPYSVMPGKFTLKTLQDTLYFSSVRTICPFVSQKLERTKITSSSPAVLCANKFKMTTSTRGSIGQSFLSARNYRISQMECVSTQTRLFRSQSPQVS